MSDLTKRFYTVSEIVEMGVMSRSTIWRQIDAGKLEALKVGAAVRIPAKELERFIAEHTVNGHNDVVAVAE